MLNTFDFRKLLLCGSAAMLLGFGAVASDAASDARPPQRTQEKRERPAREMLNLANESWIDEARQQELAKQLTELIARHNQRVLQRFDADKDGKLSETEKAAADQAAKDAAKAAAEREAGRRRPGDRRNGPANR